MYYPNQFFYPYTIYSPQQCICQSPQSAINEQVAQMNMNTRLQDFWEKYPDALMKQGNCPKTCAKDLGYCMDFANEYRMEEYGKTWVMYPYYPVSPIGI